MLGFFIGAPGMARSALTGAVPVQVVLAGWLGGASPLWARQGEPLAGRQGCPSRGGIWRKPQAKHWPDEQESHEAATPGKAANIVKAQYLHGRCGRRCGGYKCEGHASYPGKSGSLPLRYPPREGWRWGIRTQQRP